MTEGAERAGWSPEIACEITALRRSIFLEQETRAFVEHRSKFVEQPPGGKFHRRGTGEEFERLEDALEAIADVLLAPGSRWEALNTRVASVAATDQFPDHDPLRPADRGVTEPRYDLSPQELADLERELVGSLTKRGMRDCVVAAWIRPYQKYANIARAHEATYFPEVEESSDVVEDSTPFLLLVDTRDEVDRVVHAATVSGQDINRGVARQCSDRLGDGTGFIVVDDLIDMGNFTAQEFREYYAAAGLDLDSCISVETNFFIGQRAPRFRGMRTPDLAYLAIFDLFNSLKPQLGSAAVFASVNRPSIVSLGRLGLEYEPLMGRTDLVTSESLRGLRYLPIAVPYHQDNLSIFESIGEALPRVSF